MVSRGQWKFWNRRVIESVLWLGRFIWDARLVAQSCLTLCGPMDCSLPGSSVHRIFQAKILEWVAISYSRGSSQPRDQTRISCVSCISRQILYCCATWEACEALVVQIFTLDSSCTPSTILLYSFKQCCCDQFLAGIISQSSSGHA